MSYIFVHGLGQTASAWDKVLERLERQPECACPDLPELIRGKEVRQYAELYEIFSGCCDRVSGPVHLCGLSLGGILALNYAIDHPDRVLSLVLIGAQYKMPKGLLRFQNVLFHLMPGSMFDQIGFGKQDYISLSKSMMELDFSGELDKLLCPVLVLCGDRDRANQKAAHGLAQRIPNAKLTIVENAGHEVNVDAPERLAELIDGFWEGL